MGGWLIADLMLNTERAATPESWKSNMPACQFGLSEETTEALEARS